MGRPSEEKYQEFHAAVGEAICYWTQVERALLGLFVWALESAHPRAASAAYYANMNFKAKLDVVDNTLVARLSQPDVSNDPKSHVLKFDDPLLSTWATLEKRLRRRAKKRNDIAHFETMIYANELVLVAPMRSPLNFAKLILDDRFESRLSVKDIRAITNEFRDVCEAIRNFEKELRQTL